MSKKEYIRYYSSYSEDFVTSDNQNATLPENYKWIRNSVGAKALSALVYFMALVLSTFYCRLVLRLRVKGRKNINNLKSGYFIYANHTQPLGDVFTPALCVFPKRIYTIVSPANFGIPFIGKVLPYLGALPIPDTIKGTKEFAKAIETRIKQKHPIVIYPEAHVWEYYAGIRPFGANSFKFPAKADVPSVSLTVTYSKTALRKRPKMIVYISEPVLPQGRTQKEKADFLHNRITTIMQETSKLSNTEYIKYIKK